MTTTAAADIGTDVKTAADKKAVRRRTVAQAIVEYLQVQYSELDGEKRRLVPGMYGIFGHGNSVGLAQGIDEYGSDFTYYQAKNEQSAVHAAIGFAKASNRAATLACTASAGPGSTNMVTGAATATTNRLPVLLFPADIINNRFGDPVLQQIEHPVERDVSANDCFRPVSRYFDRITHPAQLLSTLPEAMRVLTDPVEAGAVVVCLPQDIQGAEFDFPETFFTPRVWHIRRRPAVEDELRDAAGIIRNARRPLLIAGGGVRYSKAQEELARFSAEFGIPVSETYAGKGSGPVTDLNLGALGVTGTVGANEIADAADVVITVGSRLQDFITASHSLFQNPDVKFVNLNVGAFDAHKMGSFPVIGDARLNLAALRERLSAVGYSTSAGFRSDIADARKATLEVRNHDLEAFPGEKMSQAQVIDALNRTTTGEDALILGSGGVVEGIHKAWDPSNGTEIHFEYANSCMGHEIPAGLGYRIARDGEPGEVYVLIGDGTYFMQPTELVTAVQERQKIITIVVDNRGHQCIWPLQVAKGGPGREFGTQYKERNAGSGRLDGPVLEFDIAANAASMGCAAWSTTTIEEFEGALAEARAAEGPAVIVAHVEQYRYLSGNGAFWDVGVPMTSQRPGSQEGTAKHLEGRARQRYYAATTAPEPR
ncbi:MULTISPECIES: 3D-(3,5/4)-trihydroxycyclohexane-1,2-dione acylhydrolase (decyclizing) [Paenarthrobacter]|uniref:3D-(3,5/4)-trihydroxycyclohexane-1,2-dione acylhydrolase (decyclizing) n=1 Tax=Paenarthrobacter TaxID=1742992 RepID=UPI00074D2C17|nr:3D-(3,5/4)-trihydroxycyclohexane-1,2-dione acylhydrolase (decyclizing) [Paenarthrobacter ureafaciens]AMB40436.1 3D-(3,5/4)-trihydroxycyclohexane-1,2-dione acylhydrolase (decyclizing) [Arthrobacter sp. ATCC 21022]KUR65012.1 thiamine pyrophosphate-binding protein [Arthrobacter sp. ATCC 21022]RWX00178.1 3D-(3,5/4)-trihydroxycyclohexane-1,2-dione acylhydrolase (decyclizing) [Paenarthrobacter ureafaciens]